MITTLPHQAYPEQDRDFVEILLRSLQTCIKVNFDTGRQGSKAALRGRDALLGELCALSDCKERA